MSKLSRKLMAGVFLILAAVACASMYVNSNFISRYYLYQEKKELNMACERILSGGGSLKERIDREERDKDVCIVQAEYSEDNAILNERLRAAFVDQGIGFDKYWLWEEDQRSAVQNGRKTRVYRQEKLNYSLLVEYLFTDGQLIAAVKIIPFTGPALSLVNKVSVAIFAGAGGIAFLLIFVLARRIIQPIETIGAAAQAIAGLDFCTLDIRTNDELETLAGHINHMSLSLLKAHEELEQKNRQMKELLSNVSHDLKTPTALITAYAHGMKDGLDDGSFADTIINQARRMEQMIESLLCLSRVQQKEYPSEPVDVSTALRAHLKEYRVQEEQGRIFFESEIQDGIRVQANPEMLRLIFSNLISNAVKYSGDEKILVSLSREWQEDLEMAVCVFAIQNRVARDAEIDMGRLWEPFYVGEQSRNQSMSGTGLGLSIVKEAADRLGAQCGCCLKDGIITFTVLFGAE